MRLLQSEAEDDTLLGDIFTDEHCKEIADQTFWKCYEESVADNLPDPYTACSYIAENMQEYVGCTGDGEEWL